MFAIEDPNFAIEDLMAAIEDLTIMSGIVIATGKGQKGFGCASSE